MSRSGRFDRDEGVIDRYRIDREASNRIEGNLRSRRGGARVVFTNVDPLLEHKDDKRGVVSATGTGQVTNFAAEWIARSQRATDEERAAAQPTLISVVMSPVGLLVGAAVVVMLLRR